MSDVVTGDDIHLYKNDLKNLLAGKKQLLIGIIRLIQTASIYHLASESHFNSERVICKRNSDSVPDRDKMFDPSKASTSIL
jgi:hypothetical protein